MADKAENPRAVAGDNSGHTVAADQLKAFVERIERLEDEKEVLGRDVRELYSEAKGAGFDTRTLRKVVKLKKKDFATRQEEAAILDLYMQALGIFA